MTSTIGQVVACLVLGLALGLVYFDTLRRNVDLYLAQQTGRAVAFHAVRVLVAVVVFTLAGMLGLATLASSMAGFLVARWIKLRRGTA